MLVAACADGFIEAARDLGDAQYYCPICGALVSLKRGRVRIPHFAHKPPTDCPAARETVEHLAAKAILVRELRALGYDAHPEVALALDRRIDVAVSTTDIGTIALEVQASKIAADEIRAREADHRRHGISATGWVFTAGRCRRLLTGDREVRVPADIRYEHHRTHCPLNLLSVEQGAMYRVALNRVERFGEEYFVPGGSGETAASSDRILRSTFAPTVWLAGFALAIEPGRYDRPGRRHLVVGFST